MRFDRSDNIQFQQIPIQGEMPQLEYWQSFQVWKR